MNLLRYHFPVIVYAGLIFFASSFSAMPFDLPSFDLKDKLVHFIEFAIFGVLLWRSANRWKLSLAGVKLLIIALVIGSLYAAFDEFHQFLVPGRNCDFYDWVADAIGLAVGIAIAYIFIADKRRLKKYA
jgi:VanZ family protein